MRIEPVARLLEVDGDLANDAAGIGREQQDAVAHQHRFLDIVGDQNDALDRQLAVAPQFEEIGAQSFRRQHVERRERLVHQQNVRMNDERAGEADALAHAAGQFARIGGFVTVEADEIDRGERPLADFRARASPSASSPSCTFSSTVSQGNSAKLWNTMAMPGAGASTGWPR